MRKIPGEEGSYEKGPRRKRFLGERSQEKKVPRRKILGEKGSYEKDPRRKRFLGERS
jgi:hypothetical protein